MENDIKRKNEKNDAYYGVGGFVVEIVKVFFLALIIVTPIRVFLFQPFFVQGASMEPNFQDGQYLIINEFGYKTTKFGISQDGFISVKSFKDPERSDTIVFRYPLDPKQYFIKRVIGLPGETIKIENGRVMIFNDINPEGFLLDESDYLSKNINTSGDLIRELGDKEYFVMGDNRSYSHDSRSWGPLNEENIIGKVLLRAWPISKAKVY